MSIHNVILTKYAKKNLTPQKIDEQIATILAGVNNKSLKVQGWTIDSAPRERTGNAWTQADMTEGEFKYIYSMFLVIEHDEARASKPEVFHTILRNLHTKASQPVVGQWALSEVDGTVYKSEAKGAETNADEEVAYAEVKIPEGWEEEFNHLYGLEFHVEMVMDAIQAALDSDFTNRFNTVLYGPPACGKTDTLRTFRSLFGDDAVWEFDCTAMTAAGAIKRFVEADILPRIVIFEEIEKAPKEALAFLMGICDLRGEVNKTTARQDIQRDVKVLALATVNDMELFRSIASGAISSRFPNEVEYQRPDRMVLGQILTREIRKVDGDLRWIEPTLAYAEGPDPENPRITDPRKIISICLCGKDKLLTGRYQEMLRRTSPSAHRG